MSIILLCAVFFIIRKIHCSLLYTLFAVQVFYDDLIYSQNNRHEINYDVIRMSINLLQTLEAIGSDFLFYKNVAPYCNYHHIIRLCTMEASSPIQIIMATRWTDCLAIDRKWSLSSASTQ